MSMIKFSHKEVTHLNACIVASAKNDVRYYLNGIYLDRERGAVVGSNGHHLFAVKHLDCLELEKSIILDFKKPFAKKVEVVTIESISIAAGHYSVKEYDNKGLVQERVLQTIDGVYPDWHRLLSPVNQIIKGQRAHSLDWSYPATISKALKQDIPLNFCPDGAGAAVCHTSDWSYIVMPKRFDKGLYYSSGLIG